MNGRRDLWEPCILQVSALYGFDPRESEILPSHEGGRNTAYAIGEDRILRVSGLTDRTLHDYLAETEYVHYLAANGANVADALPSKNGNLVEKVTVGKTPVAVSMFGRARGDQIADHDYRYRDGAPIEEYWYNTGRTLGRIHALSKRYVPAVKRFDFFDKYNEAYFETLIPDAFACEWLGKEPVGRRVKDKMHVLLEKLRALPNGAADYGMVHFDFSDGNYNIDYADGTITVFDFDNCRTCWYLFDLANLWTHGVGWVAWNDSADERRAYMERYFGCVLDGYRAETDITDGALSNLPLLIEAVRLENIIDECEVELAEEGRLLCDGEQAWRLKGLMEDEPFMGFFSEEYDPESPFDLDV